VIIKQTGFKLERATKCAAGYDIRSAESCTIAVNGRKLIKTGIYISGMENTVEAQVRSRSGLALKHGVFVLNGVGTVDADYAGEVGVILYNSGEKPFSIFRGDRIAQLVFNQIIHPLDACADVERGEGGFGSTG